MICQEETGQNSWISILRVLYAGVNPKQAERLMLKEEESTSTGNAKISTWWTFLMAWEHAGEAREGPWARSQAQGLKSKWDRLLVVPGILYHSWAQPRKTQRRWLNSLPGSEPGSVLFPNTEPSSQQCPGAGWGLPFQVWHLEPATMSASSNLSAMSWQLSPTACWHCGTDDKCP